MKTVTSYHHGNLKAALLEAGERLLRQNGVAELSLRKVAREAGVSHAAPYRHFQNKRALLSALAQDGFNRLANAVETAEKKFPGDPQRQLQEASVSYVDLVIRHPETTHLMFGGVLDDCDTDPELIEAGQRAFQSLLKIISNGQQKGIYRDRETMELALAAWSLVHGLAMLLSAGNLQDRANTQEDTVQLITGLSDLLLNGILR